MFIAASKQGTTNEASQNVFDISGGGRTAKHSSDNGVGTMLGGGGDPLSGHSPWPDLSLRTVLVRKMATAKPADPRIMAMTMIW
jgi:hypothetical protein